MTDLHESPALSSDLLYPPDPDAPPAGSLLERLRQQRAAAKPDHLDLVIPSWGANTGGVKIVARMNRIPWRGKAASALRKLQSQQAVNDQAELDAECDLLISGLDQLYGTDGDTPEPLNDADGAPLRFDEATAAALGLGARKAREVVYALWGGAPGEFALKAAAGRYLQWLQASEVVTEDEGNA